MMNHHWRGSLRSISNHIDPDREDQLKWAKIESRNQMSRMRMIVRSISNGNSEGSSRKKMEAIHLMEQFQKQYELIHSLYEELRDEVKKNVDVGEDDDCSPNSDSEAFYTPLNTRNRMFFRSFTRLSDIDFREIEALDLDDKLTFSRRSASLGSPLEFREILEDQQKEKIDELEKQVSELKLEIAELRNGKTELEAECKEHVCQVGLLTQKYEDNELMLLSRIQELLEKCNDSQAELAVSKDRIDEIESTSQIDEAMEKASSPEDISAETEQFGTSSRDEKEGLKDLVKDLEQVIHSLRIKESELENHVKKTSHEASQTNVENAKLRNEISMLQESLSVKETELITGHQKIKSMEGEITRLVTKLDDMMIKSQALENAKKQLEDEFDKSKRESSSTKSQLDDQKKCILELEALNSKLINDKEVAEMKLSANFQHIDRKADEMAEELRKVFEDQFRILSRRIRVAEQLQVELKEWYRKTKEAYEQVRGELKDKAFRNQEEVKSMQEVVIIANDLLISLDSVSLKFTECSDNFLNRISKASCELNFAKQWAIRKNRALSNANSEMDCLLVQLSDKEAETLCFRERLWKSENKVRELEKMVQDNEDSMLVLKEEKREAIRQLCVWIDYHRSRSEFFKKTVSEMNLTRRKAA